MIIYESNIPELVEIFSKWENKIRNPRRHILEPLGKREKERTKKRIRLGKVTPEGFNWVPWAPATAIQRARKGNISTGLLFDTGEMYRSIDYRTENNTFSVGTNVDYAEYQQYGTEHIPAREFLGFNEKIEDDVQWVFKTIFRDHT